MAIPSWMHELDSVAGTPCRNGWRAGALTLSALTCALAFAGCGKSGESRSSKPVETAVVHAYRTYAHHRAASASCTFAEENQDGSEWWWCDVETNDDVIGVDPCTLDVRRRSDGTVTVTQFRYCLSVDGP